MANNEIKDKIILKIKRSILKFFEARIVEGGYILSFVHFEGCIMTFRATRSLAHIL